MNCHTVYSYIAISIGNHRQYLLSPELFFFIIVVIAFQCHVSLLSLSFFSMSLSQLHEGVNCEIAGSKKRDSDWEPHMRIYDVYAYTGGAHVGC